MTWNDIYIMLFFVGLTMSCFSCLKFYACVVSSTALMIPLFNVRRYKLMINEIKERSSKTLIRGGLKKNEDIRMERERKQAILDRKIQKECKKVMFWG